MSNSIRHRRLVAIAALLFAGAAAGCSDSSSSSNAVPASTVEPTGSGATEQTATAPASTAPTSSEATTAVPAALAFQAPLVGGGEFDGATYAGRPVAFWFWAPT
ncbi:MAG: hypothetical protein ACOYL9_09030 [Ilumatobacteraceae bacterium]